MSNTISCFSQVQGKYPNCIFPIVPEAVSESAANNDYQNTGFKGFGNANQSRSEKEEWAKETKELADKSLLFRIIQLPLDVVSYFISTSEPDNPWISKGFFSAKSLAEVLAERYQNKIYGRENDNLGAEKHAEEQFGDNKTRWLSSINNTIQTKVRFLTPVLGLINPDLANDIDLGLFEMIDSSWWRKMSLNSGFYPGIIQDLLTKTKNLFTKKDEDKEHPPTWTFIKDQFKNHLSNARESKRKYEEAKGTESEATALLKWCKNWDQLTSVIMPFVCLPSNLVGDTLRPILRRLNVSGPLRTIIRTLSVADRGLVGVNYWFRFYKPEQIAEKKNEESDKFKFSNLYLASLVGDVANIPLTIFEDKVKEMHPVIQHGIEVMRIFSDWSFDMFWPGRRKRIAEDKLKELSLSA